MKSTSGPSPPRVVTSRPSWSSDVADDAAFVVFYESELPLQVRRAALLVGSPEIAHDLVHDAFVAALLPPAH